LSSSASAASAALRPTGNLGLLFPGTIRHAPIAHRLVLGGSRRGTHDAVLDLIDDGVCPVVALQAGAEDLGDLVGGQSPRAKLTASLEQLVDRKVAFEHKIEAVLDLAAVDLNFEYL